MHEHGGVVSCVSNISNRSNCVSTVLTPSPRFTPLVFSPLASFLFSLVSRLSSLLSLSSLQEILRLADGGLVASLHSTLGLWTAERRWLGFNDELTAQGNRLSLLSRPID